MASCPPGAASTGPRPLDSRHTALYPFCVPNRMNRRLVRQAEAAEDVLTEQLLFAV